MTEWIDTDTGEPAEELKPKPRRRSATVKPAEETRKELEEKGAFVSPIREESYPAPIEEPPVAIDDPEYLQMLETVQEVFAEDLVDAEGLAEEIERVRSAPKPSLVERLVQVASEVDAVEKKGWNKGQQYSYQKAVDVVREVRSKLYERGILMTMSINETNYRIIEREGGKAPNVLVDLHCTFRVTDGVEVLEFDGAGMGIDPGDKGIYKAITGALKYGLRTLLLIPDERDDPEVTRQDEIEDSRGPVNITPSNVAGVMQGGRQTKATQAQMEAIRQYATELGMTPETLLAYVSSTLGKQPAIDPDAGPNEMARQIMDWLAELPFAECGQIVKGLVEAARNDGAE